MVSGAGGGDENDDRGWHTGHGGQGSWVLVTFCFLIKLLITQVYTLGENSSGCALTIYNGVSFTRTGTRIREITDISLIKISIAGPAVSLSGSPTVSPVIAAL